MEINQQYIDSIVSGKFQMAISLERQRSPEFISKSGVLYLTLDPGDDSLRIRLGSDNTPFNDLPVWRVPLENSVEPIQDLPKDTKLFYSNCLWEALKAKLRNWKSVKIYILPPKYNEVKCCHFMWTDGVHDYDFGVNRYLRWYQRLWFRGTINRHKLGWAQRLIRHRKFQNGKGFAPLEDEDNP